MTIDRAVAVIRPFQWQISCSKCLVRLILILTCVWSISIEMPWIAAHWNDQVAHSYFITDTYNFVYQFLFSFVPISVLVIANVIMVLGLWCQTRNQSQTFNNTALRHNHTHKIVIQVFFVSLISMLAHGLYICSYMMEFTTDRTMTQSHVFQWIETITLVLFQLNSVINFLFYYIVGAKFRRALKQLPCW